jgi:hypothetical protein
LDKYYQVFGNLYLKFKNKQQMFPGSVGIWPLVQFCYSMMLCIFIVSIGYCYIYI